MKTKLSKEETKEKIDEFFREIKNKTPREIKKIKQLAMRQNAKLGKHRREFCKKCLNHYTGKEKVRIKGEKKIVICNVCGKENRLGLLKNKN